MTTQRIRIPPGQQVRISLPGGETIVLSCDDEEENNNSSGSEMPENFVQASLGAASGSKRFRPGPGGGKKTRKAGKRAPNGYMKFAAEIRPQILKENPEMKSDVTQVARKIGEKWRAMSAAEKAKY